MATIIQPHCIRCRRPLLCLGLLPLGGEPPGSLPLAGLRFLALPLKRTIFVSCLQPRLVFLRQDRPAWVTNCFHNIRIVIAWKREGLGSTPSGHGSTRCARRTRLAVSAHAGDEPLAMWPALRTALAVTHAGRAKGRAYRRKRTRRLAPWGTSLSRPIVRAARIASRTGGPPNFQPPPKRVLAENRLPPPRAAFRGP